MPAARVLLVEKFCTMVVSNAARILNNRDVDQIPLSFQRTVWPPAPFQSPGMGLGSNVQSTL